MPILDDVAEAIQKARGRLPQPIISSVKLEDQFGGLVTPAHWAVLQRRLGCPLPPLEFVQGHWFLPDGFATIWDLCSHVSQAQPDWELPVESSPAEWRNAQIFAGVRSVCVEALNVDPSEVVRGARLRADLGAE